MAKIEEISIPSLQFTEVATPTAPSSGRIKLYAKSDHGLYKQSSDGTETLLVPDTRFKGLRLAKRVIVAEGTPPAIIEFNTDDDGNALNSTLGGELLIWSGANSSVGTQAVCYVQLNAVTSNSYWTSSANPTTSVAIGWAGSSFSESNTSINILQQNIIINSTYSQKNSSAGGQGFLGGGMTSSQTTVSKIKLYLSSGTFPAGTVVEWHERG